MTNTTPWFDTREGIEKSVSTLTGFNLVLAERRNWRTEHREGGLQEWVVYGRFVLDTFGQCMTITEGVPGEHTGPVGGRGEIAARLRAMAQANYERDKQEWGENTSMESSDRELMEFADQISPTDEGNRRIPQVASVDEARLFSSRWSMTFKVIPDAHAQCPQCLRGWTIRDLHDVASHLEEGVPMHGTCSTLKHYQSGFEQLQRIAHAVWPDAKLTMIPNEYDGRTSTEYDFRPPWALIASPYGPIRIGWRRRVIHIDWEDAPRLSRIGGAGIVARIDITHGDSMVHCYSEVAAVCALQLIEAQARIS